MDLLAIPSVSTDPAFKEEVNRAADWVAEHLVESGLVAEVMPTGGHPCVVAHAPAELVANPEAPRVLFYGHYDVQPPDPLEGWTSPPFEPVVREGKVYARGASDDKGQVLCFLEALRAYREAGEKLPGPVTVMIEGEEECGSENLNGFVDQHKDKLACDVVVVSDTSMWDAETPAITTAMRGLVYFDVKLHGPSRDLHSGVYGGSLANPATELMKVIGRLKDTDNRIAIPGFYDDVAEPTSEQKAQWDTLGFDENQFTGDVGSVPFGEAERTTLERRWTRPSCDVNGLYGGYMGEGAKTVIPTFAGCKVSFRIPADMDPSKVAEQFEAFCRGFDVGGCRWEFTNYGEAYPVAISPDSDYVKAACKAVEASAGVAPVLMMEGATVPVIAEFKTRLGVDSLLVGFGLNGDNIHSPDEHFALDRYELGIQTHKALLAELAGLKP